MEPKTELQVKEMIAARKKELDKYQMAEDLRWINSRMNDTVMGQARALILHQAEQERQYQERTDHAAIVNEAAKKETALATAVAEARDQEYRELLRRQYLREQNPDLRELMNKLEAAYVCRDQKQQILRNEYKKLQEKEEEAQTNRVRNEALYNEKQELLRLEQEKLDRTTKYCQELRQQLVNRQQQKQCQYEDTLIEKTMIDDVMKTISDEDMRELKQKRELQAKIRNEMLLSQQARAAWKEKQKQMSIIEKTKIEEQLKQVADRSSGIKAERDRRLREKEEINEKVVAKILAEEAERNEREEIIRQLLEQEHLEKNINDGILEREKVERFRKDQMREMSQQMESRRKIFEEQKRSDESYKKIIDSKIREDEEKDRQKEARKQELRQQYAEDLKRQMEENRTRKLREKQEEKERDIRVFEFANKWSNAIAEERKRILSDHAPKLLGYLQPGVLKKEDIPSVREGANRHEDTAKLDIESMANCTRRHQFPKCNAQCRQIREY